MTTSTLLQDDGLSYLECNDGDLATTNGFLHQRRVSVRFSPRHLADPCLGSYERQAGGKWRAFLVIAGASDSDADAVELGIFDTNIQAMVALWKARPVPFRAN
jgi:hypothetical protein